MESQQSPDIEAQPDAAAEHHAADGKPSRRSTKGNRSAQKARWVEKNRLRANRQAKEAMRRLRARKKARTIAETLQPGLDLE